MSANYQVHSEPSMGHWASWVTSGNDPKPSGAVILVGQTQEEAEAHARLWAERLAADPTLLRV